MPIVVDEVWDGNGKLLSRTEREVPEPPEHFEAEADAMLEALESARTFAEFQAVYLARERKLRDARKARGRPVK